MHWALALQEFDVSFKYKEGKRNTAADCLSRVGPHLPQPTKAIPASVLCCRCIERICYCTVLFVFLGAGVDELHEMCLILLCTLVIICAERPMSSLPSVLAGWLARELARHRWSTIVRIHLSDCWTDVVIVNNILGGDGCRGLSTFGTSVWSPDVLVSR